jgi:phosphatidate cytidylyltransferase
MVANAAMAPSPARGSSLKARIVSALLMAPVALAAVWYGSPWLDLLTIAAAGVMAWEWARLCGSGTFGPTGVLILVIVVLAVVLGAAGRSGMALAVGVAGAGLVLGVSLGRREPAPNFTAIGVLWLAVPCVALLWLARDMGSAAVLWVLAVVWASDIGAYAVGRTVGGPKLAPRISPGKTWSGLFGGMACAAAVGFVTAKITGGPLWPLVLLSGALAAVGQAGDLAESSLKRRFGVKDASGLIPGHGGLLDRLDALLAVVATVAVLRLAGAVSLR